MPDDLCKQSASNAEASDAKASLPVGFDQEPVLHHPIQLRVNTRRVAKLAGAVAIRKT